MGQAPKPFDAEALEGPADAGRDRDTPRPDDGTGDTVPSQEKRARIEREAGDVADDLADFA